MYPKGRAEYGQLDREVDQGVTPIAVALMGVEIWQLWMETSERAQTHGDPYDRINGECCACYDRRRGDVSAAKGAL